MTSYSEKPWLKNYFPGVRPHLDYTDIPVHAFLEETAAKYPDRTALLFLGKKMSFRQLNDQVDRMAAALGRLGVQRGDRVAFMLPNSPQMVISVYATFKLGAVGVGVNPLYTERELVHQLGDAGAETIIFLDLMAGKVAAVAQRTPLKRLIVTGIQDYLPFPLSLLAGLKMRRAGQTARPPGDRAIIKFTELIRNTPAKAPQVEVGPSDLAVLQYTGGTTGLSKGAMLTHRNLVANTTQLIEIVKAKSKEGEETFLCVLPYFHSFGLTVCMNCAIRFAATQVLIPRFDVKMILRSISKYKVTFFPGTPTMYIAVLQEPGLGRYDISSLKQCISGAAPLPLEVQTNFQRKSGASLTEGYGLSECSPVTHCNPFDAPADGSIGFPVSDVECKIVDPENRDVEVPVGEVGELAVKGPQVMSGYWNRPEENREVLRDGWLLTGDMARMDENGKFYLVERKKDLIIAGGFNIYPREVEEVLYGHPKVLEAAVVGVPHERKGEAVKAFVVLKPGQSATQEEIVRFCRERLAPYKVPRFVEFRTELPKTLVGKILKRALLEEEGRKTGG